jgi:hypothetical protein
MQKFSILARQYIMGYHVLQQMQPCRMQDLESDITGDRIEAIIPTKSKQMKKKLIKRFHAI